MFSYKYALVAAFVCVLMLVAAPVALGLKSNSVLGVLDAGDDEANDNDESEQDDDDDDGCEDDEMEMVNVTGTVTAWVYDDDEDDEDDEDDDEVEKMRPEYFVIEDDIYVEFGPWWYWMTGSPNVTSVVHVGDEVNVTGELEQKDNMTVLCAWTIENQTTGEKLTIKEEGAPSWAGGPKAFGIDPWPPC